ncbi:hypothetical protein CC2G_001850 [Coprinopsis cinerea AmutBmut pab1-1]|nr:hypothetical protein CC2G_001850 [Coprinopsis cinerea AmutBmut pab1-1]
MKIMEPARLGLAVRLYTSRTAVHWSAWRGGDHETASVVEKKAAGRAEMGLVSNVGMVSSREKKRVKISGPLRSNILALRRQNRLFLENPMKLGWRWEAPKEV